jgi:hypothetical protein
LSFWKQVLFVQKGSKSSKFALKVYEGFLLGYDSNSHAYHVFNMNSSCVEITCDVMFDETNGTQKEQVDLDLIDDEEAPCDALQRMAIADARPKDPSDQHGHSTNDTTPPTQGLDQDKHEGEDEHHDQVQEESNDQGGDEDDGDNAKGDSRARSPHPRVCHNVQRDHPVNNILGDIEKG